MISVVLASYNGEKYIEKQLESFLRQTRPADEVIICDDCSTDRTVEIVSGFIEAHSLKSWKLVINSENKGYSINFLDAVNEAAGDLIFMSDQDDVWHADKLEKMAGIMQERPDITALCCSCGTIDSDGERIPIPETAGVMFHKNDGSVEFFNTESFIGRSFIRGCSVCFRSCVKAFLAPIELKGLLSHDWLVTFTAALIGKCGVLNTVLMEYRCHGENNSFGRRKTGMEALRQRIFGIACSVNGHEFVYDNSEVYRNMTQKLKIKLEKQIIFEKKRIAYLENGGFLRLLRCFMALPKYRCYYGTYIGALKVFAGDIFYRKNAKSA